MMPICLVVPLMRIGQFFPPFQLDICMCTKGLRDKLLEKNKSQHENQDDEPLSAHMNATYVNNFFRQSKPISPLKSFEMYTSKRLKRTNVKRKPS